MKKNEQSFDSFIIVESENKIKQMNNNSPIILTKQKSKSSQNKIRNQIFGKIEENFDDDFTDSIEPSNNNKNKDDKEINSLINKFELCDKEKDFDENDEYDNEEDNEDKKISKKNLNKDGFIYITAFSKEKPQNFEADISLINYKKSLSYTGKINITENFGVKINLSNKNNLYFNDSYYEFNLLEIKSFSTTQKYSYDDTCIEINLKDCRNFIINLKKKENFNNFVEILENFSAPIQIPLYFRHAFFEHQKIESLEREKKTNSYPKIPKNGWEIYDFEYEFNRQGVDFKNDYNILDNSDYKFCETYPAKIITPKVSHDIIEKCAYFRKKKRLPALTYRHSNGYCIWRSSQTKSGFTGKDDKDVLFLTRITQNSKNLVVYDARPKLNAMANKLKGGGYENPNNYTEIKMEVIFCDIPNIHSVRSSFEKLLSSISYISDNDYSVISNLPNTFWYETIILILKGGFQIYHSIKDQEKTVLIHCSDGWDRTSQLSALSQILLDKYYRTLEGFIVLIEKDWLSFGHQFRIRNGFCPKEKRDEFSPIFLQWLDCVYQIMEQNCTKFEFNVNLLTYIAERIFCGKYGTFLFNTDKERKENNAKENTISIWTEILDFDKKNEFINPIYDYNNDQEIQINYKKIKLWKDYFLRFEKGQKEGYYVNRFIKKEQKYKKELDKKNKLIEEMSRIITKQGINPEIFSPEAREEIKKYLENSTINYSFELMKPTESVINMKNKDKDKDNDKNKNNA